MNIVFIVSHREYSDWSIDGLFSTKELAQKWIDEQQKTIQYDGYEDKYYIKEWEIDRQAEFIARKCYNAVINWVNGNIETQPERFVLASSTAKSDKIYDDEWLSKNNYPLLGTSSFISQEHANKLAVELRQKVLRLKGI